MWRRARGYWLAAPTSPAGLLGADHAGGRSFRSVRSLGACRNWPAWRSGSTPAPCKSWCATGTANAADPAPFSSSLPPGPAPVSLSNATKILRSSCMSVPGNQ
jgi:hypothetical protein